MIKNTSVIFQCQPELVEGGFEKAHRLRSRFLREHFDEIELLLNEKKLKKITIYLEHL